MIKKNDFIELTYTGTTEDGAIFDTTNEKTAKDAGIHQQQANYGPMTICIGQGQLLQGLDDALIGKEVGKTHKIELAPEQAFGKKSAKLVQLIPLRKFKEHDVQPVPGLQVNIDNQMGTVKTVSGGRVLVDFNHPLSSKNVVYEVKVTKLVEDDNVKLESFVKMMLGLPLKTNVEAGKATIELPIELNKEMTSEIEKKVKEAIPAIKDITFSVKKEAKKEEIKTTSTEK